VSTGCRNGPPPAPIKSLSSTRATRNPRRRRWQRSAPPSADLLTGTWTDREGHTRPITEADIIVVAPYNLQVNALRRALPPGIRVGTVDKFQGQEAPVCLVSMTASSGEEMPRGMEFLLSRERINVAVSRAKGLALVFASPRLLDTTCTSVEAAFENARKRREHLAERRADLSARIDTRAQEGVEERRDEVAERLRSVTARADRYAAEVEALVRLRDALEVARDGAREAYFEPVQEELRPLLRILHDDAGIDWETDSITPGALRRGGETEAFETLSGGTQEQIAILTRLAFARLFARRGQHLPIILDDALVYSDDDRIVKMFTALNRVALDQQIIVFSCRQLAFAGLGGDRPSVNMEDVA
jgi:hypothetical protein